MSYTITPQSKEFAFFSNIPSKTVSFNADTKSLKNQVLCSTYVLLKFFELQAVHYYRSHPLFN